MTEQNGFRLHIREDAGFQPPALLSFPKGPSILYSATFMTGVLWRSQSTTLFEVRAIGLRVKKENGMISLFVRQPDGIGRSLFSFVEKFVAGITDLDDKDIVPEVALQSLLGKPDPRRFYISPLQRPIQKILRDSLKPVATPPFLPHSQDV